MLIATIVIAGATVWNVIYVKGQLEEMQGGAAQTNSAIHHISDLATQTKRQADEIHAQFAQIKREADAAEKELGEMKTQTSILAANSLTNFRSFTVGERPFVYFGATQWYSDVDPSGKHQWAIQIPMGNSGKTPAIEAQYSYHCTPSPIPLDKPWDDKALDMHGSGNLSIGAGREFSPLACTYSDNAFTELLKTAKYIYAFGRVVYRDTILPKLRHVTEFCYRLSDIGFSGTHIGANELACGGHNCADDECRHPDARPHHRSDRF